jgi:hypothetical protein
MAQLLAYQRVWVSSLFASLYSSQSNVGAAAGGQGVREIRILAAIKTTRDD